MTEQEALAELKSFPVNCLDFKEQMALDMAIEAMEKQIPMKPITDGSIYSTCDKVQYICPSCNEIMVRTICTKAHKPKYCYKCGQKLDWSEV